MTSLLGFHCVIVLVVVVFDILGVSGEVVLEPTVNMTEDEKTSQLLNYLLDPDRYDKRFRPKSKGPPVYVLCDFFINSFDSITETTMDYGVSIFMRQRWTDPRLSHNDSDPIFLHDITRLWTPDAFFTNEKSGHLHTVTVENQIARIYQDGFILCSTRYSLKLACYMSLERFPMDTQVCKITMESYGYTTKDLIFDWHADKPIQTDNELKLPQFRISDIVTFNCTKSYTTGSFTCIEATFTLHREVGYYILQAYLPSIILVVLSWVSFWISYEAAPARVALGVTTILTLTTLDSGIRSQLPKVSYPKAIDIWMAVCLVFVFAALVEFAGVNYISVYEKKVKKKKKDLEELDKLYAAKQHQQSREEVSMGVNGNSEFIELKNRHKDEPKVYQPTVELDGSTTIDKPKRNPVLTADNVDKASRYIFPAFFITFNIVYWICYQAW
ncbi:glycine receptor subunit alpha-2-like [Saccoglossus kowalevskii]|uniref:Glycine receptor subunit alpha-3-like n=1 Tax=Saccoglossus kowalevskii TaxID=10224 RepID=A0ABM0GSK2_SACKO|nr:PREDICTED: glycine receptor subunit alpha-3-like [Saccoglossus kowalevskii]